MRIKLNDYQECCSIDCPFSGECAQHSTAGDFRADGGFAPNIRLLMDPEVADEVIVECETADESEIGCAHQVLPASYYELDLGYRRIFG